MVRLYAKRLQMPGHCDLADPDLFQNAEHVTAYNLGNVCIRIASV